MLAYTHPYNLKTSYTSSQEREAVDPTLVMFLLQNDKGGRVRVGGGGGNLTEKNEIRKYNYLTDLSSMILKSSFTPTKGWGGKGFSNAKGGANLGFPV